MENETTNTEQVTEAPVAETVKEPAEKSDAEQVWEKLEAEESAEEAQKTTKESTQETTEATESETEDKTKESIPENKTETVPAEDYKAKYDEISKEIEKYREAERKAQESKVEEAKKSGFDSLEEQQAHDEVVLFEFKQVFDQVSGLQEEYKAAAMQYLQDYVNTRNPESLLAAKSFLSPIALEKLAIEKNAMTKANEEKFLRIKQEQTVNKVKEKLTDFVKSNREWLENNQTRIDTVGMIVDTVGIDADLGKVKEMVDKIEAEAIKRYESKKQAESRKQQLSPINNAQAGAVGEKWFTKAEIDKMSEAEYVKNSPRILEQMALEQDGQLPRKII